MSEPIPVELMAPEQVPIGFLDTVLRGPPGDPGADFQPNATGLLTDRGDFDAEAPPFAFLATDTGDLYFREGATAGGWSVAVPFGGSGGGGTGDVDGPASSVDGRAALFDGTTGKRLKQSAAAPVLEGDSRLTNSRTPTTHAASHGDGGSDAITVAQSQVTGLGTALAGKEDTGAAAAAVTAHEGASDPHPQYLTQTEGDGRYRQTATALTDGDIPAGIARDSEVTAAITAHEGAADPHPSYLTASEGNASYAPLGHVGSGGTAHANAVAGGAAGFFSGTDKTKLDGIAAGAEVNVNADWNAGSGDAQILNKPTLGTAAATDTTDYGRALTTNAAVTAGTNAQGSGVLTADVNVITSTSNNPSGVTLPTASVNSPPVVIINRGTNPVNVYPASGAQIDVAGTNNPYSLAVGARFDVIATSSTQWQSSSVERTSVAFLAGTGTGVNTALAVNVGSAGAFVTFNGAGGTPSALTLTNATGLPTSGITNFNSDIRAQIEAALVQGTNITITPSGSGATRQLTLAAAGGGGATSLSILNRGTTTLDVASDTGTDATIPAATTSLTGLLTSADKTKLDGIATAATANATDAALRDRATHTGTQAVDTITGLGSLATLSALGSITSAGAIGSTANLPIITGTSGVLQVGSFGTTANTFAQGNDSRFHDSVTLGASVSPVFNLTGQALGAVDHGADRLLFWDDSAGTLAPLTLGANLTITGTTLDATVGGGSLTVQDEGSNLSTSVTTINFTGAGVTATGTSTVTVNVPTGSGGNVSNSGTPTTGQIAEWVTATTVQGIASTGTGDVVRATSPTLVTPALGTPASGNLANCTFPTLNQSTTGSAATLTTSRKIGGSAFNGSADVTSFPSPGAIGGTTPAAGTFTTLVAGSATSLLLGTAGTAVGSVGFRNATSGTITVQPTTGALGTSTVTLPAVTGTAVVAATSTTTTQAMFATATAGAPAFRAIAAGDIPTLNQNTTGSAATLTTTRTIGGSNFNGSANVTSFPAPGAIGGTTPSTGVFTTLEARSATSLLLGVAGTAVGSVGFRNATSGTITLAPPTGALGTVTLTLPAITDTLVSLTATQTLTNKTLTSPTLTTPALGTPASGTLTSCTGLPPGGLTMATARILGRTTAGSGVAEEISIGSGLSMSAGVLSATGGGGGYADDNYAIPANVLLPQATGPALATITTTTNGIKIGVADFDGVAVEVANFTDARPKNWSGANPTAKFLWQPAASGSGAVVWGIAITALNEGDVVDVAPTWTEVTDAVVTAERDQITAATAAISIQGTVTADSRLQFWVRRNPAAGGDTMAQDARLVAVVLTFALT